jgi:hypothetical protein
MSERPNTVCGLIDKRRELAGRIEHVQHELRALVADLDHIDAVIRIFDPDADIGPAKRYPAAHMAFRGERARHVMDALGSLGKRYEAGTMPSRASMAGFDARRSCQRRARLALDGKGSRERASRSDCE